ncbi:hypothetical protein LEN26_016707 [Aphanomyces euteiches]|nr:hypothetical protein LEN26_016707 [Aphanomyces euteiches]
MNPRRVLLLVFIITTSHALWTLTLCPAVGNTSVPCLQDPSTAKTNILEQSLQFNQSFDLSGLGISSVQSLPPNATQINLSNNNISQLDCQLPSSLSLLNLSRNALLPNWLGVSLPATKLDVSYNRGGLSWMPDMTWQRYLPRLRYLFFRGNKLKDLWLSQANLFRDAHCAICHFGHVNSIIQLDYEHIRVVSKTGHIRVRKS